MLRIEPTTMPIPADYRNLLRKAGIDEAGGRAVPEWSPEGSLEAMSELGIGTAILSVSAPGTTFLPIPADAAALARDVNDYLAGLLSPLTRSVRFLRHRSDATRRRIRRRGGEVP